MGAGYVPGHCPTPKALLLCLAHVPEAVHLGSDDRTSESCAACDQMTTDAAPHLLFPELPLDAWPRLRKARADFCSSLS